MTPLKGRAPVASISGCLTLVIDGPIRTKKNSSRIDTRHGRILKLPSKAFEEWNKSAQLQLAHFRAGTDWKIPLRCNLNCRALFLLDVARGDFLNYAQALADALQEGGIVENDSLIRSWDGSRLDVDKTRPRVIVSLEAA